VDTYWEGRTPEPISPELALVDPVLREKLLSQSRPSVAELLVDLVVPLDLPAAAVPAAGPGEDVAGERRTRWSRLVAWGSVTASCATALALAAVAFTEHPHGAGAVPPVAPAALSVVTAYTPPAPPVDQRSPAEKRQLASLLRAPMRDPFARP
jgi:hypothetical protein